ncbi:MAG: hypothetical protein PHC34_07665 [Candidatus Gastranaerophilales bacterium]|nr:hypothetical protein [Candidatus Gastranaerophilales bacterium]
MDNKKNLNIDREQSIKDDLIRERKKTVTNCLNLECKNEQLKILIDRLYKLANKRENLLLKNGNQKQLTREFDQFLFNKSSITDELEIARVNSEKLEKAISRLKFKISTIDEELTI